MEKDSKLRYVPFTSSIDGTFWYTLSKKKIDVYGLKDDAVALFGHYGYNHAAGVPCLFQVDYASFDSGPSTAIGKCQVSGELINCNTIEKFKTCNKQELLQKSRDKIWQSIVSGAALQKPSLLNHFILLTFANLKKYHYHYWFGFPSMNPPEPVNVVRPVCSISTVLDKSQIDALVQYSVCLEPQVTPFFALNVSDGNAHIVKLADVSSTTISINDLIFVFLDPSTLNEHPGWPLQNYLCLISKFFVKEQNSVVKVIGLRDRTADGVRDISHSIYLEVNVSPLLTASDRWKAVGWERNNQQKLLPKFVNMSKSMDPAQLASSAVDLNLKLMRWRLLPDLDLDSIAQAKCLLLGAGTLGCNVARNLLGWGVRNITLVDNSTVSFSNPVRQSLFTFDDCLNGGKQKAEAAADSLKKIFPGVNATGLSLCIPMPGHSVQSSAVESVRQDFLTLEKLISEHDAVFLLMDTRESRWLPTVIGAAKNKIVLTAALGFDSWLAMRHGARMDNVSEEPVGASNFASKSSSKMASGSELGCYYCNDVVAPRDSTKDRTLDQQCTVSRPGISMLCSALIVELFVSVVQHPLRGAAPSSLFSNDDDEAPDQCVLGLLPHQIRGYLSRYQMILPTSLRFKNCTACSDTILKKYEEEGFEFLLKAFNDGQYLEEVSGLKDIQSDPLGSEVVSDFDVDEDDW